MVDSTDGALRMEFEPASRAEWGVAGGGSAFVQYFGRPSETETGVHQASDRESESAAGIQVASARSACLPQPLPISVLVLGASKSGKATLIRNLLSAPADDESQSNGPLDFSLQTRVWDGEVSCKLQVWRASANVRRAHEPFTDPSCSHSNCPPVLTHRPSTKLSSTATCPAPM